MRLAYRWEKDIRGGIFYLLDWATDFFLLLSGHQAKQWVGEKL